MAEASEFAAGLQQRLAEVTLKIPQGTIGVTCSIGIAEFQPGDNVDDLMKRADLSLYRSKKEGRNRIASSPLELSLSSGRVRVTRGPLLPSPSLDVRERRAGLATSQELLARVCAIVDLLIASGQSEELATHIMAQKMVVAGVSTPKSAEGRNWWQAIHAWRAAVRNEIATAEALKEYDNVVRAFESVPPRKRVKCALESELWNRRRLILHKPSGSNPNVTYPNAGAS